MEYMGMLKISELIAFQAVVDAGSVTRAASRLGLTQPTVSKLISGLESRLGFPLFERARRRLVLAPDGEAFHREAERFLANADALTETARYLRDHTPLRTRMVCMPALAYGLLPRALSRLQETTEALAVTVEIRRRAEVTRWIAGKHFDLGLANLPVDYPGITTRRLVSTHAYVALPRQHRLAKERTVSAAALASDTMIGMPSNALIQERAARLFRRLGLSPRFSVTTSSLLAVCHFVAAGIGCAIVDPFTANAARNLAIKFRPLEPSMPLHYGLLFDKEKPLSPQFEQIAKVLTQVGNEIAEDIRQLGKE
jgi:DNA-binding transcriptional LysR family regulator